MVSTTRRTLDARAATKSSTREAASLVAAKASRNSASEGRASDQAIGVCTAVMSSWPKSTTTSRQRKGRASGASRTAFQRRQTFFLFGG